MKFLSLLILKSYIPDLFKVGFWTSKFYDLFLDFLFPSLVDTRFQWNSYIFKFTLPCEWISSFFKLKEFYSQIMTLDFPTCWIPASLIFVSNRTRNDRLQRIGARGWRTCFVELLVISRSPFAFVQAARVTASAFLEMNKGPTRACR